MCYYRLYIFLSCGHSTLSLKSIRPCAAACSSRRLENQSLGEEDQSHESGSGEQSGTHAVADPTSSALEGTECESSRSPSPHPKYLIPTPPATPSSTISSVTAAKHDRHHKQREEVEWTECGEVLTHPFQTVKLYTSCSICTQTREQRLTQLESRHPRVRIEDWRWKVKYLSPVPEEARYAEWGNSVGAVMGSWVQDWKIKGDGLLGVLREQVFEVQEPTDGDADGRRNGSDLGRVGYRGGMTSS